MSKHWKFFFLILISLFIFSTNSFAQTNWELGARIGDQTGFDATIPLKDSPTRLHPSVYLLDTYIGGGAYFDWLFEIAGGPEGLRFYPGVGPEIYLGTEIDIAIAGNFGVEFMFDFPLTMGIDWRPRFMVTDNLKFRGGNVGLTVRFRFGEGVKFIKSE